MFDLDTVNATLMQLREQEIQEYHRDLYQEFLDTIMHEYYAMMDFMHLNDAYAE